MAAPPPWRHISAESRVCIGSCRERVVRSSTGTLVARSTRDGIDGCTGVAIGNDDALAVRRKVLVAPRQQRDKNREEITTARGRHVFVARWMIAVLAAFE